MNVDYTIAVCNYNMAETIEESLRSILDQIDDRFEVLLVDDASTDNSAEIVHALMEEYNQLRIIELDDDPGRYLGETRYISVRESQGDHVLLHLDADDVYQRVIPDFIEIYTQLRNQLDGDFFLNGSNITVGPRDFLLEYGPYRNLPVGAEDLDLWRRLLADDVLIWLDHKNICREIGYKRGWRGHLKREFNVRIGEFQSGVTLRSYLSWSIMKWRTGEQSTFGLAYDLTMLPICFLVSETRTKYTLPEEYNQKSALPEMITDYKMPISEIEEVYNVTINPERLSNEGKRAFINYIE